MGAAEVEEVDVAAKVDCTSSSSATDRWAARLVHHHSPKLNC